MEDKTPVGMGPALSVGLAAGLSKRWTMDEYLDDAKESTKSGLRLQTTVRYPIIEYFRFLPSIEIGRSITHSWLNVSWMIWMLSFVWEKKLWTAEEFLAETDGLKKPGWHFRSTLRPPWIRHFSVLPAISVALDQYRYWVTLSWLIWQLTITWK